MGPTRRKSRGANGSHPGRILQDPRFGWVLLEYHEIPTKLSSHHSNNYRIKGFDLGVLFK